MSPSIAVISIYVTDMEASIAFYRDVLGFGVRSRPVPFITELDHEGVVVVLCLAETASKATYPSSSGTVIGIASEDIAARAKALKKQGVKLIQATPQEFPGGTFIVIADPSGNPIELLQFGA
jgi:predicted enzyme related to lactoylglutathione lyase